MSTHEMTPQEALAAAERNRRKALAEGTRPWGWRRLTCFAAALVAMGVALDADMIWLFALFTGFLVYASGAGDVALRRREDPTLRSPWWLLVFAAVLAAHVVAQFPARALEWPIPNTVGAVAAAAVFLAFVPWVQRRLAVQA